MGTRLQGKIAIISGGAKGIGGAASELSPPKAPGGNDRPQWRGGGSHCGGDPRHGHIAEHFVADVSDEAQVEAAVKAATARPAPARTGPMPAPS